MRLALFWALCLVGLATSIRIKDNIYRHIKDLSFGFKRANGTHEMGATSDVNGNVGVVHLILDEKDLDWLIQHGPHQPYIAVLSPTMFKETVIAQLRKSNKVNGVVLVTSNNTTHTGMLPLPNAYSDDNVCPNSPSSLYGPTDDKAFCQPDKKPWNPSGSNILNENWPFPIFKTSNEETVQFILHDCYEKFNKPNETTNEARDWPLCAIELKSHMYLAVDSPTCLRRTANQNPFSPTMYCDKLGDKNIFMMFENSEDHSKENKTYPNDSIIVVATKLDVVNFFDKAEFGAESPATGIVTLLTIASILSKSLDASKFKNGIENVLFAFFNGEAFDYIGSSRMMYDMSKDTFPEEFKSKYTRQWPIVKQESLKFVLEIGQAFNKKQGENYYAHVDTRFEDESLLTKLKNSALPADLKILDATNRDKGLPPSSLQAILKERRNISGIVVNDFDDQFLNQYYHSIYDNSIELGYDYDKGENQEIVESIYKLSAGLAMFIYEAATGSPLPGVDKFANKTLINEMLYCYLVKADCTLFTEASTPDTPPQSGPLPPIPYSQYITVDRSSNYHTFMTYRALGYLTGTRVAGNFDHKNCTAPNDQNIYQYVYYFGDNNPNSTCKDDKDCLGFCTRSTVWLAEAISPAFLIDGYDFSSAKYSAWTESVWKTISGRIFLKASPTLDKGFFALGVIITILSFAFVFWTERNASVIFGIQTSNEGASEPAHL